MTRETRQPRRGDVVTDGENFVRVYSEPEFVQPPADDPPDAWWRTRDGYEKGWWRAEVSSLNDDVEGGAHWTWTDEGPVEVVEGI